MEMIKTLNVEEIRQTLEMPDYEFPHKLFAKNEHLTGNVALLCLGGSLSYGSNLPEKLNDIDLRGVFMETPHEIIGSKPNPQKVVDTETDTVMYSFNRIVELLLENNPNTILLGKNLVCC